MGLLKRPRLAGIAAAAAIIAVSGGLSATAATASTSPQATPSPAGYATVSPVIPAAAHGAAGSFSTSQMSIEIVLAPGHQARLSGALTAAYANPAGSGHWLAKGQFAAQYAPAAATRAAVEQYLRASGLSVSSTGSAFLVRASGTSAQVSAAFRTKLSTYKQKSMAFFANSTAAAMPATLAKGVLGVVGLNNTVRIHAAIKPRTARRARARQDARAQLRAALSHGRAVRHHRQDRRPAADRLRCRARLQRPVPVPGELHLRRAERRPAHQGQGRDPRPVRAVRLPGQRRQGLHDPVLRPRL
jgi:hypothetical protein